MDARQRTTPKALQEDSKPKTFREAFSQAYRDNPPDFTVKRDVANKYGVSYFLSMMFLQYYVLGWIVIPHLVEDWTSVLYWRLFGSFLLIQSFFNWFQVIRKYLNKAEKRPEDSNKTETSGWKLCAICQYYVPPRSHHCKLCNACILRRDHHCFFAGGCVGHFTYANFLFMCLWILITQCIAFYWEVLYIQQEFTSIWMYIAPSSLVMALVDANTWFNFLLITVCYCTVLNIGLVGFYFLFACLGSFSNITFYEGSKGIKRFTKQGSVFVNIRAALGAYYWIRWLIPFYTDPEGNGYDWDALRHSN